MPRRRWIHAGLLRPDGGWEERAAELAEQGAHLRWRPDRRHESRGDIHHQLTVDIDEAEPTFEGRPLRAVLAEGLAAYGEAFRAYLSSER